MHLSLEQSECQCRLKWAAFLQFVEVPKTLAMTFARVGREENWSRNMDLIALTATFVLSVSLGLAGSRAILSGVLFVMSRPISRSQL